MEDQPTTPLYTLTEEGDRYVIRRPSGETVFRVRAKYRSDAYELLANLNALLSAADANG